MPLLPGKQNVGKNIATEEAAGKPRKQAIAIALHVEGDTMAQSARTRGGKVPEKEPFAEMMAEAKNGGLEASEPPAKRKQEMVDEKSAGRGHKGPAPKKGGYEGY